MDEIKKALLESIGIDAGEALDRFMGNEGLMLKFLLRFPTDESFSQLRQAVRDGDLRTAFEAAHTLKGVAGNLSMKEFYQQVGDVVEDLRSGNLNAAVDKMPALEAQHARISAVLSQFT